MLARCLALLFLPVALALPAPAAAQSAIETVATVVGGLTEGAKLSMGTLGEGVVRKDAENAFEAVFASGVASFIFESPRECVFSQRAGMTGWPTTLVFFNFNLVESIDYQDQGKFNGLNAYVLQMKGADGILQVAKDADADAADMELMTSYPFASLLTSLTLEDLKAAAAKLRELCPGIPGG